MTSHDHARGRGTARPAAVALGLARTLLLLLLAFAAAAAEAATVTLPTFPTQLWTNLHYTVSATSSEAAPAGNGDRLLLDCGAAAAVTPVAGFSLSQATAFDFVITTAAAATSGECVFTRTGDYYGPATQTTAITVAQRRTLTVSLPSTFDSPIVVGADSTATLTFTPSADLADQLYVHSHCRGLVATASRLQVFVVQLQSGPASVSFTMGSSLGMVECSYSVMAQLGEEELAAPPSTFLKIVPTAQLVATMDGAGVPEKLADSLAPATRYTLSVAPPPPPLSFGLTLYCMHDEMTGESAQDFTEATTAAHTFTFTTPAAPAAGSALSVWCYWKRSGVISAYKQNLIRVPSDFNFYIGSNVAVTSGAASQQLGDAKSWESDVTLTAVAGTVFAEGGIRFTAKCSVGFLSPNTFSLTNGMLTATATYYARPVVGSATAASCTFTLLQQDDFRRVKVPVADLTFEVAAAIPELQLIGKGLPTAADVLVAEPAGVIDWATASAGVPIVVTAPADMAAGTSVTIDLRCGAPKYGATVAVTPATATFSGPSPSPATFIVAVTRADPATTNALSDLVYCYWSRVAGDSFQWSLPADFTFVIGKAVQLEVRQNLDDTSPFSGVVQGQRAYFYVQSAGEQDALVGGDFRLSVSCGPCGSGEFTGEGFLRYPSWLLTAYPFPRLAQNTHDFTAVATGVVTCRWSLPARFPWARSFIAPVPTVITILPLVEVEVRGVPTAADLLPRSAQKAPFYLPQPVAPGQVFTITMAAAPAEAVFGKETNTFTLYCSGGAVVSGDGVFLYSESSRGPLTQTLTMPLLTDSQPVEVDCSFDRVWGARGPMTIFAEGTQPNFQLLVVDTPTVLTPRLTQTGPLFTGGESHVSFNPSRTVKAVGELLVDVACAMSAPVDGLTVSGFGKGVVEQAGQMQGSVFTFRLTHADYLLTAEATDLALVFGYKLGLPAAATTLTCTHTLPHTVNGLGVLAGSADRMLSMASNPIVITVLPTHSVAVTGVPTGPLGNAPTEQTISVLPNLLPNAVFTDQQTLLVTLSCPGLTLSGNGLLTFTGTGTAALDAQPITFTPHTVTAGAGNVWQCAWQLGGTDAQSFQAPAAFDIVVGVVDAWTVELADPSASMFVGGNRQGRLRAPGSMPGAGTMTAECDQGRSISFSSGGSTATFSVTDATIEFTFGSDIAGTPRCRFRLSGMPAGFPLLPPAPLTFSVRPQSTFTIDGFTSRNFIQIAGGVGASLSIAPTAAPGAGGVTLDLVCQTSAGGGVSLSLSATRVFFPTGSTAAQTIELGRLNDRSSFLSECSFTVDDDDGQFVQPAPFVVDVKTARAIVVSGLDSRGRFVAPSACDEATFTVGPAVVPTADQGTVTFDISCDGVNSANISPVSLTFSADSWQPQTVTVRAPGAPISARCWMTNDPNHYTQLVFPLVFGSPPVVTVDAPTFVPLGAVAPITLRPPPGLMFFPDSETLLRARCSHRGLRSELVPMSADGEMDVRGMTAAQLHFHAAGQRTPVVNPKSVSDLRSPVTMALPRSRRAKTAAATPRPLRTNKKEQHEQRQRRAAKPLAMSTAAAVGLGAVANELVTCTWELYGHDEARFSLQMTSTFLVGSAVEMTGQLADGAVSAVQGQAAMLIVAPNAAMPVDVDVTIECSTGVSVSTPTVTLAAGATGGQSVTLIVAAGTELGSASCTLTPSGAGRLAVSNSPTVAFTIIEPAPTAPSSSGGGSSDSSSSSGGGGSSASDSASTGEPAGATPSSSAADGSTDSDSTGSDSAAPSSTGPAAGSSGPSADDTASSTGDDSPPSDSTASGSSPGSSTASQSTGTAGAFTSSSSTGDAGGVPGGLSSSSSGATGPPCTDFECAAWSATPLPGLAALVAALLAASFAQQH